MLRSRWIASQYLLKMSNDPKNCPMVLQTSIPMNLFSLCCESEKLSSKLTPSSCRVFPGKLSFLEHSFGLAGLLAGNVAPSLGALPITESDSIASLSPCASFTVWSYNRTFSRERPVAFLTSGSDAHEPSFSAINFGVDDWVSNDVREFPKFSSNSISGVVEVVWSTSWLVKNDTAIETVNLSLRWEFDSMASTNSN